MNMNFNFNNQRTKFHLGPPIMRHFSTIGLVAARPETTNDFILKPDYIFKNVQNHFLSGNIFSSKSFSNPNFVNKQNPNVLTPSIANAINFDRHTFSNFNHDNNVKHVHYNQQPKHDSFNINKKSDVNQTLPEKLSSQTTQHSAQIVVNKQEVCSEASSTICQKSPESISNTVNNCSPKTTKKNIRNRNRRNRKKRCKQDSISISSPCEATSTNQNQKMTVKKMNKALCSSPKKFKKELETKTKNRKSKKFKPWHKINFDMEITECNEIMPPSPITPEEILLNPTKSCPIPIKSADKCVKISPERMSISVSPCTEFLVKNLSTSSTSTTSDLSSISSLSSSPAICRLRIPSECDSEDSFIIFCDDGATTTNCLSDDDDDDAISDSETDCDETDDSDFDIVDFVEKTDLNRETTKKKVTFKCGPALCEVHPMIKWDYAYHTARMGPWEQYARDRERFENRIRNTSNIISPVLTRKHREKIYHERFEQTD